LEKETFNDLASERQICAYKHPGFWMCMNTFKDNIELNELWKQNKAPWKDYYHDKIFYLLIFKIFNIF